MNIRRYIAIMFMIATATLLAGAQDEHRGVRLYREGKNAEARDVLSLAVKQKEYKSNAEIWNTLGLAYVATGDLKNGRKALEKTVKLGPTNSVYHSNLALVYYAARNTRKTRSLAKKAIALDSKNVAGYYVQGLANLWDRYLDDADKDAAQTMMVDATFAKGYVLKSHVLLAKLALAVEKGSDVRQKIGSLKEATDVLRRGLQETVGVPDRSLIEEEFESVNVFYDHYSKPAPGPSEPGTAPEPGVTPLRVIRKPRPAYTESARQGNVQGTIVMAVLFGANGRVRHTLLLKRLGSGLDEQARKAAFQIVFEPMARDGKPVSVVKMVEYTFAIY